MLHFYVSPGIKRLKCGQSELMKRFSDSKYQCNDEDCKRSIEDNAGIFYALPQ